MKEHDEKQYTSQEIDEKRKKGLFSRKNKQPKKTVPILQLFRFASTTDRILIFIAAICSAGTGALTPISIIFMGSILNSLSEKLNQPSELLDATMPVILIFVYMGTGILVASYVSNCFWVLTGENQAARIRKAYMNSIMHQDMSWFDKANDGSLTTRLASDTQIIQDGISEKFGLFITCVAQFIAGIVVAFVKGWNLAVVMLATIPVMLMVGGVMSRLVSKYTVRAQNDYAEAGSVAEQVFSGIRTIYSFSLQERFAQIYDTKLDRAMKAGMKRGAISGAGFGSFMLVLFSTFGLAFWYGASLIREGKMNGATVMVAFYAMMMGTMSLNMLPPNLSAVSSAAGAAYKIFETIDRVPEINKQATGGIVPTQLEGRIEFKNVKFHYPTRPDITILKNLDLVIKPGQTVAFVGPSGSGKSTSVQLLQRFYDPIQGQVCLDGHDLKQLDISWLRSQMGVVSQEPVLFNMSIRQNLLLGVPEGMHVTEEDLIRACTEANCHSFVSKLPDGYDTLVGDQGGMLSGGQKQRIAIARAILKNPSILLLDEATSALDTQSERLVQHALDAASANRTTIVIAHRLSTIRNADLIVVMDHGELVERGTHQELLLHDGIYADLVKKQEIAMIQEASSTLDNPPAITSAEEEDRALLVKMETNKTLDSLANDPDALSLDSDGEVRKDGVVITTLDGADVYQLKIAQAKAEKKRLQLQNAPVRRVVFDMKPEWPLLLVGLVGAGISGAIFPVYAFVFSKVITTLIVPGSDLNPGPFRGVNLYAFIFVVIGIAAFIGMALQTASFEVAGERYSRRLRSVLFRQYIKQEVGYFDHDENHTGSLTAKLAVDARNVNELITKVWGDVFQVLVTSIVGLIIAFAHSWALTLVVLCMVPFIIAATSYDSRVAKGYEDSNKKANAQCGEVAGEAIKEIRTVTTLNRQAFFEDRYAKANARPHHLAVRKAYLSSIAYALLKGITMYTSAVAFYAGIRFISDGMIDFQQMYTAMMTIMMASQSVGRGTTFTQAFPKAKYAAISIFEIIDRRSEIDPELEGKEPPVGSLEGAVEFNNVGFAYPARPDNKIFNGQFNLHGEAGKTVALVGPSGCGKSTTIGMLERWYDPFKGQISLDDQDVTAFSLRNLRAHMALVGQEPVLFDMSIGENIRFGMDDLIHGVATQAQIEEACKSANIHDFIVSLPEGYGTRVGDKGSQLSGGQKQRIAIARALIRKPTLLLLDEATSALDSDSEKVVQAALDNIIERGNRTTVTIAHRLSTIQNADLICVIKDGVVAEQGTHWELLKLDGLYKALVLEQSLAA
ncbi:P-loop containing nucleoside triphosphate hydrolase protein [Backusella circina FSU 941]|nr:P-loop containing nucleoside triphosphate hydrolase protein [Backusella circina FSU 941]